MRLGKLTNEQLKRLVLDQLIGVRPEIVLRPDVGVDCAAVDLGEDLCVLSTDPITAAGENLGTLAVHVCCNDAAACGAEPIGLLTTLLLPPGTDEAFIEKTAREVSEAAVAASVDVLGGHTEVTDAVNRPVISATVIARSPRHKLVSAAGMKCGDDILLTKWAGLEGTVILAEDFAEKLQGVWDREDFLFARGMKKYLSVVKESEVAMRLPVSAMHDVTEGGVLGAVWEMAEASGCGAALELEKIPVLDVTERACRALGIDPLRLISSGAMLIATPCGEKMQELLCASGIAAEIIGKAVKAGVTLDGEPVEAPEADELLRLF